MPTSMKFEGLSKLSKALGELPEQAGGRRLNAATREGAKVIAEEAAHLAPRATEHRFVKRGKAITVLADSILVKKVRGAAAYFIGFAKSAFHGLFAELGTVKWAGKPFLRPALRNKAEQAVETLRDKLAVSIERWRRRTRAKFGGRR